MDERRYNNESLENIHNDINNLSDGHKRLQNSYEQLELKQAKLEYDAAERETYSSIKIYTSVIFAVTGGITAVAGLFLSCTCSIDIPDWAYAIYIVANGIAILSSCNAQIIKAMKLCADKSAETCECCKNKKLCDCNFEKLSVWKKTEYYAVRTQRIQSRKQRLKFIQTLTAIVIAMSDVILIVVAVAIWRR